MIPDNDEFESDMLAQCSSSDMLTPMGLLLGLLLIGALATLISHVFP